MPGEHDGGVERSAPLPLPAPRPAAGWRRGGTGLACPGGDRDRNGRLGRLRELLPTHNAIGIDLAEVKQAAVVTDHDSRVLVRASGVVPGVGAPADLLGDGSHSAYRQRP